MRKAQLSFLAVITIVVLCSSAAAQGTGFFDGRTSFLGVKGGILSPVTVTVENGRSYDYDTDLAFGLGGFVDYSLSPKMTGGLLLDLIYLDEETIIDLSMTLKARIGSSESLIFRPGFGVGYGRWGDSNQLTIRGGLEGCVPMATGKGAYVFEAMLYASPTGGDEDVWVSFGPGALIRGGVMF